ncbi:NAD(P)H-binding protein [Streptomyces sp. ISL-10]|uniref:NAD(P)-dependent oxidoreductase n=1 Tax=Streptomyces sp. ISL-10 TaxID=2819172 RepID=UPI002034CE70
MTVFGAAGNVGRRTVAEALSRGHAVTAVVRDPARCAELPHRAWPLVADADDTDAVARASAGQDVVISATRPAPGRERDLVVTTEALLAGVARTGVRLLVVGGAASLTLPGKGPLTLAEGPDFPAELGPIATACTAQLDACRAAGAGADWTYLSPPALLEPGERTGDYRLGGDELLADSDGRSFISMEDFAVALLDEAEHPRHRRTRFTVAY